MCNTLNTPPPRWTPRTLWIAEFARTTIEVTITPALTQGGAATARLQTTEAGDVLAAKPTAWGRASWTGLVLQVRVN